MAGKLVVCATPIGNLGDASPRVLEALRTADAVCCEDTRVTSKLLAAFGIHARLERLDEAVLGERAEGVVSRIRDGLTIAYCSDAGMPGVSDPGQRLVAAVREAGLPVEVLPGPSAFTAAYVASGFACQRLYFGGFFPRKAAERAQELGRIAQLGAVCTYYESPRRIAAALAAVAQCMPDRRVAVCRELTKLHEEVLVGTAVKLAEEFARRSSEGFVKGEIVLVIDAESSEEAHAAQAERAEGARGRAAELAEQGVSNKDAVRMLQGEFGISRNSAYALVHDHAS